jgi:hypothetical protein
MPPDKYANERGGVRALDGRDRTALAPGAASFIIGRSASAAVPGFRPAGWRAAGRRARAILSTASLRIASLGMPKTTQLRSSCAPEPTLLRSDRCRCYAALLPTPSERVDFVLGEHPPLAFWQVTQ